MRHILVKVTALALLAMPLSAQSVDSLIAKYVQASGGTARIQALQTLRRTGKFTGNGGIEAAVVQENKRPNGEPEELSLQGMTGVPPFDGRNGRKTHPRKGQWGTRSAPRRL